MPVRSPWVAAAALRLLITPLCSIVEGASLLPPLVFTMASTANNNSSSVSRVSRTALNGKRRAAAACELCHKRKVRCSLDRTGLPCSNCQDDGSVCTVFTRKRTR